MWGAIKAGAAATLEEEANEKLNQEKTKGIGVSLNEVLTEKLVTMAKSGGIAATIA
jgi:hypothetical protein